MVDIIYHFKKYIWYYPVKSNETTNELYGIKNFCMMIGYPKILFSDNGAEFKNNLISDFSLNNHIKHIFSSPLYPQTNRVVENWHKEHGKKCNYFL